jgi:hypothetical protein
MSKPRWMDDHDGDDEDEEDKEQRETERRAKERELRERELVKDRERQLLRYLSLQYPKCVNVVFVM